MLTTRQSSRRSIRRPSVWLTLALVFAMLVAACGSNGDDATATTTDDTPASTTTTEGTAGDGSTTTPTDAAPEAIVPEGKLVIWSHTVATADEHYSAAYEEYTEEFGVEIEVLSIPLADMQTKLVTAFGSGNPPDVIKYGAWQLPGFVDKGQLAPIDLAALGIEDQAELIARYEPGTLDSLTFDGKIYGLPTDFNSVIMYYNKDRFEAAGLDPDMPPTTWEEILEYSEALTNADGSQVGFQPPVPGDPIWSELTFTPIIEGLGGSILNDDGTAGNLNTPEGIRALEYYAELGNPDLTGLGSGFAMFTQGVVAIQLGGPWMVPYTEGASEGALIHGENFAAIPIPAWEGRDPVAAGYTWSWSVAQASENQATAWHLINWLNTREDEINAQMANVGTVAPVVGWTDLPAAQANPAFSIMGSQASYTSFMTSTPSWSEVMQSLADALDSVWFGQASAEDAAADFDSAVADILGR